MLNLEKEFPNEDKHAVFYSLFRLWLHQLSAQEVLSFPEPPPASMTGKTPKDSRHQWRKTERRLPDCTGFGNASNRTLPLPARL